MSDLSKRAKLEKEEEEKKEKEEDLCDRSPLLESYVSNYKPKDPARIKYGYVTTSHVISYSEDQFYNEVRETEEECVIDILDCLIEDLNELVPTWRSDMFREHKDLDEWNEEQFAIEVMRWENPWIRTQWKIHKIKIPVDETHPISSAPPPSIEDVCTFIIDKVKKILESFPTRKKCIIYYSSIYKQFPSLTSLDHEAIQTQFAKMSQWKLGQEYGRAFENGFHYVIIVT